MKITVAVITRNRPDSLRRFLVSLMAQTVKPYEVLIIDNASVSGKTKEVYLSFRTTLPIRYIYEKKIGIPYARNRALQEAQGKILAFIDDDCEASTTWVEEIIKEHTKHPSVIAIQGRTISLPRDGFISIVRGTMNKFWITSNLYDGNRLLVLDTKNVSIKLSSVNNLNIQFDQVFYRGSDVDFGKQLLEKKQTILYKPSILVYHWERNTFFAFVKQRYEQGKTKARIMHKWPYVRFVKKNREARVVKEKIFLKKHIGRRFVLKFLFFVHEIIYKKGYIDERNNLLSKSSIGREIIYQTPIISVAVITRNRIDRLHRVLTSLTRQTKIPSEVLIIDNGSTDKTKETVFNFRTTLPIRYIYEKKIGIPYARNRALQEAQGKILAFIDDDCEASTTWVEEIIKEHTKHPSVIAIQGRTIFRPRDSVFARITSWGHEQWLNRNRKEKNLTVCDTKNLSLKIGKIKELNIQFDYSLHRLGADVDFGKQLLEKKQTILYETSILNYHWERTNIFAFVKQKYWQGRGRAFIEQKWNIPHSKIVIGKIKLFNPRVKRSIFHRVHYAIVFFLFKISYMKGYADAKKILGPTHDSLFRKVMRIYRFENLKKIAVQTRFLTSSLGNKNFSLSVVIIVKDNYDSLHLCLESFLVQTKKPEEILVMDISNNKSFSSIRSFTKKLSIQYYSQETRGFGIAMNAACAKAHGDIIAVIQADSEPARDWCEKTIEAHDEVSDALVIQGRIVRDLRKSIFSILEQVEEDVAILKSLYAKENLNSILWNNMSFKRKILKKLDIDFSEDSLYSKYGGEHINFGNQILMAQKTIVYSPSIILRSFEELSFLSSIKRQFKIGCSAALLASDWGEIPLIRTPYNLFPIYVKFFMFYFLDFWMHPLIRKNKKLLPILFFLHYFNKAIVIFGYLYFEQTFSHVLRLPSYFEKQISQIKSENIVVAIVTRNRAKMLKQVLTSLAYQTVGAAKIIVVDNASEDDTKKVVDQLSSYLPIQYIFESTIGIPFARNRALKEMDGKILAFIDDDCVAPPNWIASMTLAHQEYPRATAIQGYAISLPQKGAISTIAQFLRNTSIAHSFKQKKYIKNTSQFIIQVNQPTRLLNTRNVSFKMNKVKSLGLKFNPSLHRLGADVDFGERLVKKNKQIIFYPKAFVFHYERNNLFAFLMQSFQWGMGAERLRKKWFRKRKKVNENLGSVFSAFIAFCQSYNISFKLPLLLINFFLHYSFFQSGKIYEKIRNNLSL